MKKKIFEDFLPIIDEELKKRRHLYQLKAIPYLDWDDFCQECRMRLYNKFHLYNQDKPFLPWVNSVIHNFLTNWWRDKYFRFSRPCLRCPLAIPHSEECLYTASGKQTSECLFMRNWLNSSKKNGFNVNMSLSMENHLNEVNEKACHNINYDATKKELDKKLKRVLSKFHYRIYYYLFIKNQSEKAVNKIFGFKIDKHRNGDSKQLRDAVFVIKQKVKALLNNDEIDIY